MLFLNFRFFFLLLNFNFKREQQIFEKSTVFDDARSTVLGKLNNN